MTKRKPLKIRTFEDAEQAIRYNNGAKSWLPTAAKDLLSAAQRWGITGQVLDIGTGTGLLAIEFARQIPDIEVVGLDLSDVALEVAQINLREGDPKLKVSFENGDAEDIPFDDDSFDLVISNNTLHLIEDPTRMFNEIQRVLRPGGRFFIKDFRRSWLGLLTQHIGAAYSADEVRRFLSQSTLQHWTLSGTFLWLSIFSED